MRYLLDSNICIYLMRERSTKSKSIIAKLSEVGWDSCLISEYTVAELLYGAICCEDSQENIKKVQSFCLDFQVIPISDVLLEFAHQKALLRKKGLMVEDADIFIGSTAVALDLVMVTENVKHIGRLQGIHIENWAEE